MTTASDIPTSGTAYDVVSAVAEEMHNVAREKGWYDPPKSPLEACALWHSEVSEAIEELRHGHSLDLVYFTYTYPNPQQILAMDPPTHQAWVIYDVYSRDVMDRGADSDVPAPSTRHIELLVAYGLLKPEGYGIEAADVVIRVMDSCAAADIDLGDMIRLKTMYNRTRPHRHGGKTA